MKQLLSGVTMIALLAVLTPASAQAPADPPSPTAAASQAPVASDPTASAAVPGASDRAQPRPKRHVQSPRRHTRYVYRWDPRWRSPADHMAPQLNAHQLYGGGGWGWSGPYREPHDSPN